MAELLQKVDIGLNFLHQYLIVFDRVTTNKFYMVLPSPQITIGLLLISIGVVVTFDIKVDLFKGKE